MKNEETGLNQELVKQNESAPIFKRGRYIISKSSTHKDLWTFVNRDTREQFSINCTLQYLQQSATLIKRVRTV